jgi:hypothetical protein
MEALEILLHGFVLTQGVDGGFEDGGGVRLGRHDEAIVHPFAVTAGGDHSRAAQVGEMTRNFGLRGIEDLHEVADADFLASYEIDEAEARGVGQGPK